MKSKSFHNKAVGDKSESNMFSGTGKKLHVLF